VKGIREDFDLLDVACYDSKGITLLTVDADSNLYLLEVKPQ